jgi:uncharacterized protein (DUF58 family)
MRYLVAFGRFWYDFLVGDRPALLLGPIVALILASVLTQLGWGAASGLALFGLVVASGGWSVGRELAAARVEIDR